MAQSRFLNPVHNQANYDIWFQSPPALTDFGMITCRAAPFLAGHGDFSHAKLGRLATLYSRAKCLVKTPNTEAMRQSVLVAELLAPLVPANKILDLAASRTRYRALFRSIVTTWDSYTNLFNADRVGALLNDLCSHIHHQTFIWNDDVLPEADRITPVNLANMTLDQTSFALSYKALWFLTTAMKPVADTAIIKTVVSLLVSLAKQGTISEDYAVKIQQGMQADLNIDIRIDPEEIRSIYSLFGRRLTAQNARLMAKHLLTLVPDVALRLQITLQQAAGSGLSTFMLCIQKIKEHPNFPWDLVRAIAAGDFAHLLAAIPEVANNIWVGYNADKGHAASKNMPTLFYVCKQLAIRRDGERTWSQYRGGQAGMRSKAQLDLLIEAYIAYEQGVPEGFPQQLVQQAVPLTAEELQAIQGCNLQDHPLTAQEQAQVTQMVQDNLIPAANAAHPDLEQVRYNYE